MSARLFGQPVRRVEDPAMLRGAARFLDDLPAGEALHLAVVRSTVAHGRVDTLDAGEALALPGVVAVATAADLGPRNGPFPHPTWFPPSDRLRAAVDPLLLRPELLRVLAGERVRYAGEPIAAVLAGDPYTAADATELVEVDLDPLPAVAGMDAALDPDAALAAQGAGDLHRDGGGAHPRGRPGRGRRLRHQVDGLSRGAAGRAAGAAPRAARQVGRDPQRALPRRGPLA